MDNITKNLQLALMCIILVSTVIAVGIEIKNMFTNQLVTLADLLLMFLYLEVLAMVRVFWNQQSISITLPLLIAITALARFIILQGKEMDPTALVYEAVAILLITGAIASLKGPLHGGANEEVMHMMNKIKKPENALKWINKALDNKDVIMGFGHRVYKSGDSRVPTMREYFGKVAKIKKDKKFEKIYNIVEKVMIDRKNIHPNVDYPTGPTYHLMGFDTDFFTPIFVISRITGWSAHIMEQHAANKLIRPLSKYKGEEVREVMLLNQR